MDRLEIFNILKNVIPQIVKLISEYLEGSVPSHENFIKKMKLPQDDRDNEKRITYFALYLSIFQSKIVQGQIFTDSVQGNEKSKDTLLRILVMVCLFFIITERKKTLVNIPINSLVLDSVIAPGIMSIISQLIIGINGELMSSNNREDSDIRFGDIKKKAFTDLVLFIMNNGLILDYEKIPELLKDTWWVIKK